MKKYFVIGNPIEHSLSPKLHNYWFKKNNINAVYEKKKLNEENIKDVILDTPIFFNAKIIEDTTPPAPKIKTLLSLTSY